MTEKVPRYEVRGFHKGVEMKPLIHLRMPSSALLGEKIMKLSNRGADFIQVQYWKEFQEP